MAGRKTKYSTTMQENADKYLEIELYSEDKVEQYYKGEIKEVTVKTPNSIPSIVGLALILGVHRETITNWAKEHRQFFDTLERLRQKQELFLIHHGSLGGYDSSFAKFLSVNCTDMENKTTQDINHDIKSKHALIVDAIEIANNKE